MRARLAIALLVLTLAACVEVQDRCASPGTSTTQITSAPVTTAPPTDLEPPAAPRRLQSKTIGFDHTTVPASSSAPNATTPPVPPPVPQPAGQPSGFYPPTYPVMGVMNPSPPSE